MSRLSYPSMSLELRTLLRRTRRSLWIALVVAIGLPGFLSQVEALHGEDAAPKLLTTQFVKRQPRLTKPLEMKKRPRLKQRQMRREMLSVKVRVNRKQISGRIESGQTVKSLAKPWSEIGRAVTTGDVGMAPEVVAEVIHETKEPHAKVDLSLEMVDIDALDTGKYHAMVIVDPDNKRNIRGFFHLAVAYLT